MEINIKEAKEFTPIEGKIYERTFIYLDDNHTLKRVTDECVCDGCIKEDTGGVTLYHFTSLTGVHLANSHVVFESGFGSYHQESELPVIQGGDYIKYIIYSEKDEQKQKD